MFTYDAFSFVQVTFIFFILLALGCVLLRCGLARPSSAQSPKARRPQRLPRASAMRAGSFPGACWLRR